MKKKSEMAPQGSPCGTRGFDGITSWGLVRGRWLWWRWGLGEVAGGGHGETHRTDVQGVSSSVYDSSSRHRLSLLSFLIILSSIVRLNQFQPYSKIPSSVAGPLLHACASSYSVFCIDAFRPHSYIGGSDTRTRAIKCHKQNKRHVKV